MWPVQIVIARSCVKRTAVNPNHNWPFFDIFGHIMGVHTQNETIFLALGLEGEEVELCAPDLASIGVESPLPWVGGLWLLES